jgi:site-specific recombinase XerD
MTTAAAKPRRKRKLVYRMDESKYLTPQERDQLELLLLKHYDDSPRDCLVLELLLRTGARASEILALRACDILTQSRAVRISGLKGSQDRQMPLRKSLFDKLQGYTRDRGIENDSLIFPITLRRLEAIWHFYRPVTKRLHCLRHSFAMYQFMSNGYNVHAVKTALGHVNIANTLIYVDYIQSVNELRRLIKT